MRRLFLAALFCASCNTFAADYATCLLENLPGLQNEAAAQAAIALCMKKHPFGVQSVKQGSGRGWFSYKSGAECAMKEAATTRSQVAGNGIYLACRLLYDEPNPFDEFSAKKQSFTYEEALPDSSPAPIAAPAKGYIPVEKSPVQERRAAPVTPSKKAGMNAEEVGRLQTLLGGR